MQALNALIVDQRKGRLLSDLTSKDKGLKRRNRKMSKEEDDQWKEDPSEDDDKNLPDEEPVPLTETKFKEYLVSS